MKKFNWEEFKDKNNKIAVHCKTEEEAKDFCKQMHEHGLKWCSGASYIKKTNYDVYKDKICYYVEGEYSNLNYAWKKGYKILEWSDYMKKEFTKADLRDGMIVAYANGKRRLVLNNFLIGKDGYYDLKYYSEDLKNKDDSDKDIVRIFKITMATTFDYICHSSNLKLIWERTETKKYMTSEEMRKKLEELTGEKIEVDPSREEMIGVIYKYCRKHKCSKCVIPSDEIGCNFANYSSDEVKKVYDKVMEDE